MEALQQRADFNVHIFTTVGRSVFAQSLKHFTYHHVLTDIGFVQGDAFSLDIEATIANLEIFLPFEENLVENLAKSCSNLSFILCDISSLGIAVAEKAGIPSVLIENFTWDWLYSPYEEQYPRLAEFSRMLRDIYSSASYRIQTEPTCEVQPADLRCGPIFRKIRNPDCNLPESFGCDGREVVFITLGGVGFSPSYLHLLSQYPEYFFIIGGQDEQKLSPDNVLSLSKFSPAYHPDLISSSDIIVFKTGYSTLAECYQSGTPSICVGREGFAESEVLETFALKSMNSVLVSQHEFISGSWLNKLKTVSRQKRRDIPDNGAEKVASFLSNIAKTL